MSYFGYDQPVVYLQHRDDPANLNNQITLPDPSTLNSEYLKEERSIRTRGGRIVTRHLGYRFSVDYEWVNMADSDIGNVVLIANWPDVIILNPHSDTPIEFKVKVTNFEHKNPNSKSVEIDTIRLSLQSTLLNKIIDLDALFNVHEAGGDTTNYLMAFNNEYLV